MYIIIFLIIFLILIIINYNIEKFENISINQYKDIIINNDEKKIFKIGLSKDIKLETENCYENCDEQNCIKLDEKKKILEKCLKCNSQKNKCFKKSIIGGNCEDCLMNEDKINCYNTNNFGCSNNNDINDNNGINPYYFQINDNNINSPYNKKCVFCWNIINDL